MPNFIKIDETVAEIWRFNCLQNGNWNFLTVEAVKTPILHHCTKFRKDRSNRCGDIAIFVIFQDGDRRHLGFAGRVLGPPTMTTLWSLSLWKKLVEIDGVVSPPKWAAISTTPPKRHTPARIRVVWAIKRENPSTGLTCRWVPEKKYK